VTPDQINGTFEVLGSVTTWMNVVTYFKDREVKGVYWPATFFYIAWGLWNLWYYPQLNQIWSFYGGLCIATGNIVWLGLVIRDKVKTWKTNRNSNV